MLIVRYANMWSGFNPHDNPLNFVLRACGYTDIFIEQRVSARVDLEIGSVFPSRTENAQGILRHLARRATRGPQDIREAFQSPGRSANARKGIWYTGENKRPPETGWDATLSFEVGGWPDNAYLPFWQLNSNLFGAEYKGFLGKTLDIRELAQAREIKTSNRKKFCVAIFRNPEPARLKAIQLLREVGPVDVFGPASKAPIKSKHDVMREYQFALCFENDLYPGYVTEKPFDAWASGCVPLYWGLDAAKTMAPGALVNMAEMGGIESFVAHVGGLRSDPDRIDAITNTPILPRMPTPEKVKNLVRRVLES